MDFNPFEKPLREIEFDDLKKLQDKHVSEGYYIEYKRAIPDEPGHTISKVIASFANTYGGWLILGIAEGFNNEADASIGINLDQISQPKETVRRWVSSNVNPNPEFDSHLVQNPDYEDYAVLIIRVPDSRDTPHIMSDGVIYRRSGEESDPIQPETDRWALDKLYQDRRERRRKKQQALQHLRALYKEVELNQASVQGNENVIRHLQRTDPDSDHYVLELFSTDAWDAALEDQLIDVINTDLYQNLQELYKKTKSTNEQIKRLRTEFLHPTVGERGEGLDGTRTNWTITVRYWDENNEEVDYLGLGVVIVSNIEQIQNTLSNVGEGLESEIQRLEKELG